MAYAGTEELARVLKIRSASAEQGTALDLCIESAWYEINDECFGDGTVAFGTPYPALAVEVNLERAVEHWQQREAAFGIIGLGADIVPVTTARDSWGRHAHKLQPLKTVWGIA
jgi:hypothetical protein